MSDNELIENFYVSQGGKPNHPADLSFYESSWDMLMSVVEKINQVDIIDVRREMLQETIWRYVSKVQISDAHMYVVEFIKWYNENKRLTGG